MTTLVGVRDKPIESAAEESLGLAPYASSLSQFIAGCDTPMTVGLQGHWGTGKTSLMNMIRASLRERGIHSVWVDTWAYAQLHDGETLALAVLQGVVDALGETAPASLERTTRKGLGWIRGQLVTAAKVAAAVHGGDLTGVIGAPADGPLQVGRLKREIAELVASATAETGRIALFVDDLDRVRPDRAVRLLEATKNFLDVPGLVTVLACDYEVVKQGLSAIMGVDEESLGRSFFDKIIQVPFRMPTARYQHRAYLGNLLRSIGVDADYGEIGFVLAVLRPSIGDNPRALKRLANSLQLLLHIAEATQPELMRRPRASLVLLGLAAIEEAWGPVADHLLHLARTGAHSEFRDLLLTSRPATAPSVEPELAALLSAPEVVRCLHALGEIVDADNDRDLDRTELQTLKGLLDLTSLNSLRPAREGPEPTRAAIADQACSAAARGAWDQVHEWLDGQGFEPRARDRQVAYRRRTWDTGHRRRTISTWFTLSHRGDRLQVHVDQRGLAEVAARFGHRDALRDLTEALSQAGDVRGNVMTNVAKESMSAVNKTWGSIRSRFAGGDQEAAELFLECVVALDGPERIEIDCTAATLVALCTTHLVPLTQEDWSAPPS